MDNERAPNDLSAVDEFSAIANAAERRRAMLAAGFSDENSLLRILDVVPSMLATAPFAADAIAETCATIAEEVGSMETAANAQYLRARIAANRGEPTDALLLIDRARHNFVLAGANLDALRTDLGRMHVLDDFGRHHDAIDVGLNALTALSNLEGATEHPENPDFAGWIRGAILENLGVAYGFTQSHQRALDSYSAAEALYEELGLPTDLARVRANRGVELIDAGYATAALDVLIESATRFSTDGDLLWNAKCLGHQADANMLLGNYVEALDLLERARRGLDEVGATAEATRLTSSLANVSLALSLHREAFDLSEGAVQTFRDADMIHDLATALQRCGVAAIRAGHPDRATACLAEAEQLFERVGAITSAAQTSLMQAGILDTLGRRDDARSIATTAVERLSSAESPAQLAIALLQLADMCDDHEALRHLQRASNLIGNLALPPLAHPLELRLGRWHRRRGEFDAARRHMTAAVDIIDVLHGMVPGESLRAVFLGDKRQATDELADLLLSLPSPDVSGAFALCESARSRTLHELMAGSAAPTDPHNRAQSDFVVAGRELNAIYNALVGLDGSTANETRDVLARRASVLERQITVLRMREVAGEPPTPRNASGSARRVTTPVLSFEVLDDSIHVFVVRDDGLQHRRLDASVAEVAAALADLDRQHSYFRFGAAFVERNSASMLDTSRTTLNLLFSQLLAPIQDLLPPTGHGDRLSIVPSSILHRVPFHALHDGESFTIERTTYTLAPSVRTAGGAADHVVPVSVGPGAVVMGISDSTIPNAAREASQIASMFDDARLMLNEEATIEQFRLAAPGASVIHLACHGIHRAENPLFSALKLADGWITAAEILKLPLAGATVVLSACDSGRHSASGGESLGLTWAFLAAGAAAVVVSLWAVHDTVTASLMTSFYRYLHGGLDHATALRRAQLDTAEQWSHPYHWAPFVLVGPLTQSTHWSTP